MQPTDIWQATLSELQLQMTQATFDTWLHDTRLASHDGNTYTIAVKNRYAQDWLENRLQPTIKRTLARLTNGPVKLKFTVAYPIGDETLHTTSTTRVLPGAGETPPELDRDQPPECRYSVELVYFDPRKALGHVQTANYTWHFWQPYLAIIERKKRMRCTGCSFALWNTLRSFPAHYAQHRSKWPSIQTLADMVTNGNRHRLMGRCKRQGKTPRAAVVGALEILEEHRIVWLRSRGAGTQVTYTFRVLDRLPLLTPAQVTRLSRRLQERHEAALARCQLDLQEWEQLTLQMLTQEKE